MKKLIILFVGVFLGGCNLVSNRNDSENPSTPKQENPIACTEEVKLCPDGSSVSRVPPNCEFAECPTVQKSALKEGWKWYESKEFRIRFAYPTEYTAEEIYPDWIGLYNRSSQLNDEYFPSIHVQKITDRERINSLWLTEDFTSKVEEINGTKMRIEMDEDPVIFLGQHPSENFGILFEFLSPPDYEYIASTIEFFTPEQEPIHDFQCGEKLYDCDKIIARGCHEEKMFDCWGKLVVEGYATILEEPEAFCQKDCPVYTHVFFDVLKTNNDFFDDFIGDNKDARDVKDRGIHLGCVENDILWRWNDSNEFEMQKYVNSSEESERILNSSKNNPITIELTRYPFAGGGGAPDCYSDFSEISLVKDEDVGSKEPQISFDSCGKPEKYSDHSWFEDFSWRIREQYVRHNISDMCVNQDESIIIAITNGNYEGEQENTPLLFRYFPQETKLERSTTEKENQTSIMWYLQSFGKRSENIIPVYGQWGSGVFHEYIYFYDFIENTLVFKQECIQPTPEYEECHQELELLFGLPLPLPIPLI